MRGCWRVDSVEVVGEVNFVLCTEDRIRWSRLRPRT